MAIVLIIRCFVLTNAGFVNSSLSLRRLEVAYVELITQRASCQLRFDCLTSLQ